GGGRGGRQCAGPDDLPGRRLRGRGRRPAPEGTGDGARSKRRAAAIPWLLRQGTRVRGREGPAEGVRTEDGASGCTCGEAGGDRGGREGQACAPPATAPGAARGGAGASAPAARGARA